MRGNSKLYINVTYRLRVSYTEVVIVLREGGGTIYYGLIRSFALIKWSFDIFFKQSVWPGRGEGRLGIVERLTMNNDVLSYALICL